ncbi:MAG: hypothetical protein ACLU93_02995 [Streptococcus sp.]
MSSRWSANIMLSPIKGKAAQGVYDVNMILNLRDQLDGLSTEVVEAV